MDCKLYPSDVSSFVDEACNRFQKVSALSKYVVLETNREALLTTMLEWVKKTRFNWVQIRLKAERAVQAFANMDLEMLLEGREVLDALDEAKDSIEMWISVKAGDWGDDGDVVIAYRDICYAYMTLLDALQPWYRASIKHWEQAYEIA